MALESYCARRNGPAFRAAVGGGAEVVAACGAKTLPGESARNQECADGLANPDCWKNEGGRGERCERQRCDVDVEPRVPHRADTRPLARVDRRSCRRVDVARRAAGTDVFAGDLAAAGERNAEPADVRLRYIRRDVTQDGFA